MKRKIVLLGDSGVGKTSLIRRFVYDYFEDAYVTTIGSKVTKRVFHLPRPEGSVELTLMIWDLLGRTGYSAFHARTFAGVHGAILVADLTRRETLERLERYWIPSLLRVVDRVPLVFAANKADLAKRAFQPAELGDLAGRLGLSGGVGLPQGVRAWSPTSAKTGEKVPSLFEALGHLLLMDSRPPDPVRELYEKLVLLHTMRTSDKATAIGALDAIFVDFADRAQEEFGDDRAVMVVLREETVRAGLDINAPSKEGMLRLVEYLGEVEADYLDQEKVRENLQRRWAWTKGMATED